MGERPEAGEGRGTEGDTPPGGAAPAPGAAAGGGSAGGPNRRRVRSLLVDPRLQLHLGGSLVGLAAVLSGLLGWRLWAAWEEASRVLVLGEPHADETIALLLAREDQGRLAWLAAGLVAVVCLALLLALAATHRVAGPAGAIARTCRAVAEGRLARPRPLRRGDLLRGLAAEVAAMVEALRERESAEREQLLAAARELEQGGEGSARAREALRRLAAEKAGRLG